MSSRQPLNARQLETLNWISDGCPPGHWEDFRYKTTCYALADRGLAKVDRRPKTWSAELTDAGAYYLQHGRYPGSTLAELEARSVAPRASGSLAVSAADYAAAIMQELEASDGETFEFTHASAYFNPHEVEKAAARSPWRPSGKKLTLRSTGTWNDRRYVARFDHDPAADVDRSEVRVPARVTRLHPAAAAYRDDFDRHEVTKPYITRACRIVHAIAVEAERRGHSLSFTASPGRNYNAFRSSLSAGQFVMEVKGHRFALRLTELSAGGGGRTNYLQARSKARWHEPRNTTFVSTGKLSIAIVQWGSRSGRKEKFADGQRATLDSQLGDLFWELEVRALEQDKVVKERERTEEVRRKEHERAVAAATIKLVEADRVTQLHARAAEWDAYQRLHNYAHAVAARIKQESNPAPEALEWLSWLQSHLALVDPLQDSPTMPPPAQPTDENLRSYLQARHFGEL